MRVLVTAASKHGSTMQIAAAIGGALIDGGIEADVVPVETVTDVRTYDGVILGSGVYVGRWLESARSFVARFEEELQTRPVWLFSSGPIGDPPKPEGSPAEVADLMTRTKAREHRVFAGQLDKRELGLGERAIAAVVKAPEGDYRPWDDIEAWSSELAAEIRRTAQSSSPEAKRSMSSV